MKTPEQWVHSEIQLPKGADSVQAIIEIIRQAQQEARQAQHAKTWAMAIGVVATAMSKFGFSDADSSAIRVMVCPPLDIGE